jgi:hypothetical protein
LVAEWWRPVYTNCMARLHNLSLHGRESRRSVVRVIARLCLLNRQRHCENQFLSQNMSFSLENDIVRTSSNVGLIKIL